jgi:cytochrome c553
MTALVKRVRNSRNVLVFAKERQMQQNFQGLCVGCHHDEFTDTAIQSFCCLVRAFLELLVVASLSMALRSARADKSNS